MKQQNLKSATLSYILTAEGVANNPYNKADVWGMKKLFGGNPYIAKQTSYFW